MYPYRVLVSYSHPDAKTAGHVRTVLKKIGARPMSDADIQGSMRFAEEIDRIERIIRRLKRQ